jgi:hypothetical protein
MTATWQQFVTKAYPPNPEVVPPKFGYLRLLFPVMKLREPKFENFAIASKKTAVYRAFRNHTENT